MAPKKATSSSSSAAVGPLLTAANFIVGDRVITKDLSVKPYSRTVVGWLNTCNLLDLCTFSANQYSLLLVDKFHKKMKVTSGTGGLKRAIQNYDLIIDEQTIGQTFGLTYDNTKPILISDEELQEAWEVMRPGVPMIGSGHLRNEFSPDVYLLSDIVDKVFCCKTGNKDRFTDEQLRITAAIVLRKDLNWAGLLHYQLK